MAWVVELAGTFVQRKKRRRRLRRRPIRTHRRFRLPAGRVRRAGPDGALELRAGCHLQCRRVQPGRQALHRMVVDHPSLITDRALSDVSAARAAPSPPALPFPGDLMSRALSARRNDSSPRRTARPGRPRHSWPRSAPCCACTTPTATSWRLAPGRTRTRLPGRGQRGPAKACASLMAAAAACGACTCCPTAISWPGTVWSRRCRRDRNTTARRALANACGAPGRPSWRPALAPVRAAPACRRRRTRCQSVTPVLAGRGTARRIARLEGAEGELVIDDCCCADAARRPAQIPGDLPLIRL